MSTQLAATEIRQGSRMRSLWQLSLLGNDAHRFGNGYSSQRQ
jgi:hypothetical protein